MRIFALLNWYAEQAEHLTRAVASLKGFADVLIAVDGPYKSFPGGDPWSDPRQRAAITAAAHNADLAARVYTVHQRWDSEVAKRAAMFQYARDHGATPDDWCLIIDADMALAGFTPDARDRLEATDLDTAEINWHDVQIDGKPCSTHAFRSMFRALPGLTVERTHFLYTVPDEKAATGRRFLWHEPSGHIAVEPTLDLTDAVTMHHFNSQRDNDRKQRALAYYADRDARTLESAGDWGRPASAGNGLAWDLMMQSRYPDLKA